MNYWILVVDCGEPGNGTNADRQGSVYTYNHTVTYSCPAGYEEQSGDTLRICQENGSWSGVSLICSGKCVWLFGFLCIWWLHYFQNVIRQYILTTFTWISTNVYNSTMFNRYSKVG